MDIIGTVGAMHNQCGSLCAIKCCKWDVTQIAMIQRLPHIKYAVLILNRPISQSQKFIKNIWNNAAIRITVDGGTRRWDTFVCGLAESMRKEIKMPDLVTGDFDSISKEIMEKYKKKGCKIIHTPNQDFTDFTKALMELNIYSNQLGVEMDYVIAIAQSSGRLDQTIGNIQTLFLARDKSLLSQKTKVFILSDDALSWLLCPGDHVIMIPEDSRKHKRSWCSLVPIGETCERVTSTGLKWNLDNQPLKFGQLVSTSNTFDGSEIVTIKCSHTILWSMRIPSVMGPQKM